MPIKGLSARRQLPRVGKIKIGETRTSQGGKEYPSKIDYFRLDCEDPEVVKQFQELYGDKPKKLPIAFAYNDLEKVFPQYYKLYGKSGLFCKGTGECVVFRRGEKSHDEDKFIQCPGPDNCKLSMDRGINGKPGCKQVGTLQFFIVDIDTLHVFQFDTSGTNSIMQINTCFDVLQDIAGEIAFVPVELQIHPQEVTNPDNKKVVIYVVNFTIPASLRDAVNIKKMRRNMNAIALPAPDESSPPEGLYPRSQVGDIPARAEDVTDYDPETGEVYDVEPDPEPEYVSLADDTDIREAMRAGNFTQAKKQALIASSVTGKWTKEQFLGIIAKHIPRTTPAPTPAPSTATAPRTPAPPAAPRPPAQAPRPTTTTTLF